MYGKFLVLLFFLPIIFGAKTCSEYWGDCSSRILNDAFPPCSGIEVGSDEHVDEIYIMKEIVKPNEKQIVTCTFVPTKYWSIDRTYIYYFDGDKWIKLLEEIAPYRYKYNKTISFNVGNKEGEKIIRCIISRDPINNECAKGGQYYDNDDLKFYVLKPLNCNISCSEKEVYTREEEISCNFRCNKPVRIFYIINNINYTITQGNYGDFYIDFSKLDFGGRYNINIFAENITTKQIYTKNITLKSRAEILITTSKVDSKKHLIYCEVRDYYSKKKINNYKVKFFVNGILINSTLTRNGIAKFLYMSKTFGKKNISCSIDESEFYFKNFSKLITITFSKSETNFGEIEDAKRKLENLRQGYYDIYLYYNISYEINIKIENIKNELEKLEKYIESKNLSSFNREVLKIEKEINNVKWEVTLYILKKNILYNRITYILVILLLLTPLIYKFYKKKRKKERELEFYKNMEKELIEKRKQIERDYLARKISESYFNRLLLENYNKLAKVRAKIKELSKK